MRHLEAVQAIVREFGFYHMEPDLREAFRFLVDNANDVEELAEGYIYEMENGVLEAWESFYKSGDYEALDLEDQRMMPYEEDRYIAAHRLVGRQIEWPDGYEETTPVEEE